jgi:hypothetical protein
MDAFQSTSRPATFRGEMTAGIPTVEREGASSFKSVTVRAMEEEP